MKREEIKAIFADATDEQLKAVMDLNGADVEKAKSKVTALEVEIKEKKADFDTTIRKKQPRAVAFLRYYYLIYLCCKARLRVFRCIRVLPCRSPSSHIPLQRRICRDRHP